MKIIFSNKSQTLPVESRFNYTNIDLSPNGALLIAINAGTIISYYMIEVSLKISV